MQELFNRCQTLITDNYKGSIDDVSLEVMTIAVMALVLRNEKRALMCLPELLRKIEVYAEKDSVLNIAKRHISTFDDETVDDKIGACVIRGFGKDDETHEVYEDKCLVVSTINLDDNPSDIIMKVTHELTHLLRDKSFSTDGTAIKMTNGISVVRIKDIATGEKKTKHFYFEEGIVQRYTNQALDMLHEFIASEKLPKGSLLARFKNDYPKKVRSAYALQVQIVDTLCRDRLFEEAVDASFDEDVSPARLAVYYNNRMGDGTAFTSLSRDMDICFAELVDGDKSKTEDAYKSALTKVAQFLKRGKVIKL